MSESITPNPEVPAHNWQMQVVSNLNAAAANFGEYRQNKDQHWLKHSLAGKIVMFRGARMNNPGVLANIDVSYPTDRFVGGICQAYRINRPPGQIEKVRLCLYHPDRCKIDLLGHDGHTPESPVFCHIVSTQDKEAANYYGWTNYEQLHAAAKYGGLYERESIWRVALADALSSMRHLSHDTFPSLDEQ